jgi:hypothetical protein
MLNSVCNQTGDTLKREQEIFQLKHKFCTLKEIDEFLESDLIHKLVSEPNFFNISKDTISLNSLLLYFLISLNFKENLDNIITPNIVDSIFDSLEKFNKVNHFQNILIPQSLVSTSTNICSDKKFIYYFSEKFSFLQKATLINNQMIDVKKKSILMNFTGTLLCFNDILVICSIEKGKFNLVMVENFEKFIEVNPQISQEMSEIFIDIKNYLFSSSDKYMYLLDYDTYYIHTFELEINEKTYLKYHGIIKLNLKDSNNCKLKKFGN